MSSCTCLFHDVPVIVNVRNNNPLLLSRPICRTNSHYYSFYPHAISLWNDLPHESKREKTFTDFTIWGPCHPWKFLQACHTHLYDQLISILWKLSPRNSCQWARSLPTDPQKIFPSKVSHYTIIVLEDHWNHYNYGTGHGMQWCWACELVMWQLLNPTATLTPYILLTYKTSRQNM